MRDGDGRRLGKNLRGSFAANQMPRLGFEGEYDSTTELAQYHKKSAAIVEANRETRLTTAC